MLSIFENDQMPPKKPSDTLGSDETVFALEEDRDFGETQEAPKTSSFYIKAGERSMEKARQGAIDGYQIVPEHAQGDEKFLQQVIKAAQKQQAELNRLPPKTEAEYQKELAELRVRNQRAALLNQIEALNPELQSQTPKEIEKAAEEHKLANELAKILGIERKPKTQLGKLSQNPVNSFLATNTLGTTQMGTLEISSTAGEKPSTPKIHPKGQASETNASKIPPPVDKNLALKKKGTLSPLDPYTIAKAIAIGKELRQNQISAQNTTLIDSTRNQNTSRGSGHSR